MTPRRLADLISAEGLAALREHREFRAASESAAAHSVAHFQGLAPGFQWITKDIGRGAICFTALTLHLMGGLTGQALTAVCVENGVSSAGRVQQVVRRCQDIGEMIVEPGPGLWTRRPMRVGDGLIQALRERAMIDLQATLRLAPELSAAAELAQSDDGFVAYALSVTMVANRRRDIFALGGNPLIGFFLEREAGMLLLFGLIGAQSPDRGRLLEAAKISRYALSRRYGVSRAHINKLLAESGQIELVERDRVVFSEALSTAMERHYGNVFQLNRCAAEALVSGWRFDPRLQPRATR